MIVRARWWGGSSYAPGELEQFPSVRRAREVFQARLDGHDPMTGLDTPCVDATAEMLLYYSPEATDSVVRLTVGHHGAVRYELL